MPQSTKSRPHSSWTLFQGSCSLHHHHLALQLYATDQYGGLQQVLFTRPRAHYHLTRTSIIGEDVFTFEVGPSNEKIQIHPSVVKSISQPLYALMTNGHLEESINGVARLPAVEAETFQMFVQWAYSRTYHGIPSAPKPDPIPVLDKELELRDLPEFFCCYCAESCPVEPSDFYPFCDTICVEKAFEERPTGSTSKCTQCGYEVERMRLGWYEKGSTLCRSCKDSRLALLGITSCTYNFLQLAVGSEPDTMTELLKLRTSSRSKSPLMLPLSHAKLHVFADMYLVNELKQISLWRLHRDLTRIAVTESNRKYIKELLLYTYANTAYKVTKTACYQDVDNVQDLRTLILTYVLEHAQVMLVGEEMVDAIGTNQALLRDLLTGLAARTKA